MIFNIGGVLKSRLPKETANRFFCSKGYIRKQCHTPITISVKKGTKENDIVALEKACYVWNRDWKKVGNKNKLFNVARKRPVKNFYGNYDLFMVEYDKTKVGKNIRRSLGVTYSKGTDQGILLSTKIVIHGYIKTMVPYNKENHLPKGKLDMVSIIIHELGHVLGLNHYKKGSVMYTRMARGKHMRTIDKELITALLEAYQYGKKN